MNAGLSAISASHFSCATLRRHVRGEVIERILAAAVQAVEPGAAVRRHMQQTASSLQVGERSYLLSDIRRVYLLSLGKAAVPMGIAAAEILGELLYQGIIITKTGQAAPMPPDLERRLTVMEAGHPVPDERSVQASTRLVELLHGLQPDDLVIALISGGGSALLTLPAEGISLEDLQSLTGLLLGCGASIFEINTLRKHLERLKGGGLARCAAPAGLAALALSDVIGDALDVIASGPGVPDPTTFNDALHILKQYHLEEKTPPAILARLREGAKGQLPETPKPDDPVFTNVRTRVIGSNRLAAQAAIQQARAEGMQARLLTTYLQGEARQAGRFLAALGRELASEARAARPACLVLGGETTVTLRGSGLGGRNQELALGAAQDLAGLEDILVVTLATDGGDGPTDAAGAVVSGATIYRARRLGLDAQDHLQRNDAYHFFQALDDLLKPGPTQTNVNDLAFVFAL
jgi:hydroxypyruvate reductase